MKEIDLAGHSAGGLQASLVVGDVNCDGRLDVVVTDADADDNGAFVLLGNGDGTLGPGQLFSTTGLMPRSLTLGDLNRDGKLDIVAGTYPFDDGNMSSLLGNGDGTFGEPVGYYTRGHGLVSDTTAIALADLNGDGLLDAVSANGQGSHTVTVLFGAERPRCR